MNFDRVHTGQFPMMPSTTTGYGSDNDIGSEERRDLRSNAMYHSVLLHGETDMEEWMRDDKVASVIKTADALYSWVISGE